MSERKSRYNGYTEAQKRANEKYIKKFTELKIRIFPEKKEEIVRHALENNESTSAFIKRAIEETMENDKKR